MKTKLLITIFIMFLTLSIVPAVNAANFYLSPQTSTVNIGDVFGIDIGFNNNENVLLNGVVLTFSYDEEYLQLQDTDTGNMTGTGSGPGGTNIMDAKHFSGWDTNLETIANQQQNWTSSHPYAVHYEVMYSSDAARGGIFGRAYFKALKSTTVPTNLIFGSYYGRDEGLYIDPNFDVVNVTGNVDASVNVVPEPNSLALLVSGLIGVFGLTKRKLKEMQDG